tara:strand:- start:147 stop:1007 length:861 start_codon:yes stop_codon:yes gene_type:complete
MSDNGILVVGSLHYDIILNAAQQPKKGETLIGKSWFPKFGGKGGNQAIAAASYGVSTKIVSAVGNDDFGQYILNHLNSSNVNYDFVNILNNEKTGMSVAISDKEGEYGAVIISGASLKIDLNAINNPSLWTNSKILMIQNEIKEEINILAAKNAKLNGLKICFNASPPKKLNHELIDNIDFLILNINEAEMIANKKILNKDDAKSISKELSQRFELVIITLGENGVVACESNKEAFHIASESIDVKSTHGAGDVFAGIFCAALTCNESIKKALEIANKKAAFHVAN